MHKGRGSECINSPKLQGFPKPANWKANFFFQLGYGSPVKSCGPSWDPNRLSTWKVHLIPFKTYKNFPLKGDLPGLDLFYFLFLFQSNSLSPELLLTREFPPPAANQQREGVPTAAWRYCTFSATSAAKDPRQAELGSQTRGVDSGLRTREKEEKSSVAATS